MSIKQWEHFAAYLSRGIAVVSFELLLLIATQVSALIIRLQLKVGRHADEADRLADASSRQIDEDGDNGGGIRNHRLQ